MNLRSRAKITYQTFGLLQVELSVTIVTRETSKVNLIFRDSLGANQSRSSTPASQTGSQTWVWLAEDSSPHER